MKVLCIGGPDAAKEVEYSGPMYKAQNKPLLVITTLAADRAPPPAFVKYEYTIYTIRTLQIPAAGGGYNKELLYAPEDWSDWDMMQELFKQYKNTTAK